MNYRAQGEGTWLPMAQLTTVMGLALTVAHWGMPMAVALCLMIALFACGILGTMWSDGGLAALPRILRRGVSVGLMATAYAGLATTLGLISVLVAGAVAISHPQARTKVGTLWTTLSTLPEDQPSKTQDHRELSDAALCKVWQSSHAMLRSARTPTEKAEIVQLRQDYLDELQRRYPDGLAAWLASGAAADANPHRFLTRG